MKAISVPVELSVKLQHFMQCFAAADVEDERRIREGAFKLSYSDEGKTWKKIFSQNDFFPFEIIEQFKI